MSCLAYDGYYMWKNIFDIFNSTINNKQEFRDDLGVCVPPWGHHNTKFSGQKFCENEDLIFSICQVTSLWSFDQSVMWLSGWEPVRVSQHRAQFGFHRSSTSGGMYLIYHMNSQNHLFKWLCDFMSGNLSSKVTTLQFLVSSDIAVVEI